MLPPLRPFLRVRATPFLVLAFLLGGLASCTAGLGPTVVTNVMVVPQTFSNNIIAGTNDRPMIRAINHSSYATKLALGTVQGYDFALAAYFSLSDLLDPNPTPRVGVDGGTYLLAYRVVQSGQWTLWNFGANTGTFTNGGIYTLHFSNSTGTVGGCTLNVTAD